MKTQIKIFFLILAVLTLNACAYTEPNATFTVTSLAFGQGDIFISVSEQNKSMWIKGEGEDLNAAITDIKTKLSKEPSFEHCGLVVLCGSVKGDEIENVLNLCGDIGIPLRTRLVFTDDIEMLFDKDAVFVGEEAISLLKHCYKEFGFGGNTALYEIKTAILVNGGNFALPRIVAENNRVKLAGLCRFENKEPKEFLNLQQSKTYAKENIK
ncbi:MAG: hypothetical protein J6Q74_01570 [Clostridia bacterium]|nr:hypothetical protein [Clostridia bacterium]